jgi:hypothetical protein
MKMSHTIILSLSLLASPSIYAVHAEAIRYNNQCLNCEDRGNPDHIDAIIFGKPLVNHDHILATPTQYVTANREVVDAWRTWIVQAATKRLAEISSRLYEAAAERLSRQVAYFESVQYPTVADGLIAIPEQDIVLLMQWAQHIIPGDNESEPNFTITLDDNTSFVVRSNCGDLYAVIQDHIYWQKVIEAGWVAVDADNVGRVQPIMHTNSIGEKFHFYKTRFGVYFRETLGSEEKAPGDLIRIIKYFQRDPRHNESIHGKAFIVWLKFPADAAFNPTLDGQYIPNTGRAETATWSYAHDLQTLYAELQNKTQKC